MDRSLRPTSRHPADRDPSGRGRERCGLYIGAGRLAALLLAFISPVTARARNDQPLLAADAKESSANGRGAKEPRYLSLDRLDAALELDGEFETRRVRIRNRGLFDGTRQRNVSQLYQQQLALDLDGSIYDPELFSFSGGLGLGLEQERERETFNGDADTDRNSGYLANYDLRADFFRSKKLSGSVYGLKTQDRYARPFLPSLREERNDYGLSLYWTDDHLPMELSFEHRSVDRSGSRANRDDENLEEDLLRYQATWITSPTHSLRLTTEYGVNNERFSGSRYRFDNQRSEVRLEDELLLGDQRQHRLDTILRYQDEQGDYARDVLEIGPRLSLRHTDQLATNYQYQYSQQELGQLGLDTHRADWQLVHRLYDNLTTTVDMYGLRERTDEDSETWEFGGGVDWSYVRNNPYGEFSADLALASESDRTSGDGLRAMIGESGRFLDPLPIVLSRMDVREWTIVVRDSTRRRFYVRGVDYFVRRLGGRIVLFRNFLGTIPNGGSVSIDYLYRIDRGGSRDTQRVDFRIQQAFSNGITPYYQFDFRHDDRDLPFGILRVDEFESQQHRVGVKYRKDRFVAGAEFELLKDTIDPYLAYRLSASHNVYSRGPTTLDAAVDFSHFFFERRGGEDTMILELSAEARTALATNSDVYLNSIYRYEYDGADGRGVIHGVDLEGGLSWRWGKLTVTATVEYDLYTIADSKEDGVGLYVKVRRDFPGVLAALK